ncbi:MAG: hypothetical protein ACK5O7_01700 [Holosporales bacterium]
MIFTALLGTGAKQANASDVGELAGQGKKQPIAQMPTSLTENDTRAHPHVSAFHEENSDPDFSFTPLLSSHALHQKILQANQGDQDAQNLVALYEYAHALPEALMEDIEFGKKLMIQGYPAIATWGRDVTKWVSEDLRRFSFVVSTLDEGCLNFPTLLRAVQVRAERGEVEAIFHYALCVQRGLLMGEREISQLDKVIQLLQSASEKGHGKAAYHLASLAWCGALPRGHNLAAPEAMRHLAEGALKHGFRKAASLLSVWSLKGVGMPQNTSEAVRLAFLSCDPHAVRRLFVTPQDQDPRFSSDYQPLLGSVKAFLEEMKEDSLLKQKISSHLSHLEKPGLFISALALRQEHADFLPSAMEPSWFSQHHWRLGGQDYRLLSFGHENVALAKGLSACLHQIQAYSPDGVALSKDLQRLFLMTCEVRNQAFADLHPWLGSLEDAQESEGSDEESEDENPLTADQENITPSGF